MKEDSFDKATEDFVERLGGFGIVHHVHPADRREILGYLIRLLAEKLSGGKKGELIMWQDNIKRPQGLRLKDVEYKTLLRCASNRKYCVEFCEAA